MLSANEQAALLLNPKDRVIPMINSDESLQPTPVASRWGEKSARIFLIIALVAVAIMIFEAASGRPGVGSLAASILGAPWSVLLAPLAGWLHGRVPDTALRVTGVLLALASVWLNSRIVYGIAARTERDLRSAAAPAAPSPPAPPADPS